MGLFRKFRKFFNSRKAKRKFRLKMLADFQKKLDQRINARRSQWDAEDDELRQVMTLASGGQASGWTTGAARKDLAEMRGRIDPHRRIAASYDAAQTTP